MLAMAAMTRSALAAYALAGRRRFVCVTVLALSSCGRDEPVSSSAPTSSVSTVEAPSEPPSAAPAEPSASAVEVMPAARCRPDMVKVTPPAGAAYCVDRYEAALVDHATERPLSPFYSPIRKHALMAFDGWQRQRLEVGPEAARLVELPELPAFQRTRDVEPRALSKRGVLPNGHVTGHSAATACKNAGKRLCTPAEWRTACGGEAGQRFPYGPSYEAGACNVFREAHPAAVLHGDASVGHNDPRLNRVRVAGKALLRTTGETTRCASRWGDDAIYDMVGNLDEWLEHERGSFAGGFYARSSKDGCDWRSKAHANSYADYSTGVRCCLELP
ncbi:MAG: SUMF1/EgtB/PvdO family nonheme iron enzyme [Deltaproteobacteria bacterium]|nr:SUMF1/EgtB/PvdO family nonheme iron enzyme [Deltaproteobacteria bacterium]